MAKSNRSLGLGMLTAVVVANIEQRGGRGSIKHFQRVLSVVTGTQEDIDAVVSAENERIKGKGVGTGVKALIADSDQTPHFKGLADYQKRVVATRTADTLAAAVKALQSRFTAEELELLANVKLGSALKSVSSSQPAEPDGDQDDDASDEQEADAKPETELALAGAAA